MSQENVEIVRRFFDAWNANDVVAARELFDPEVVIDRSRSIGSDARVYRGRDEAEHLWRDWHATWEVWRSDIAEYIDAGDDVVVLGRGVGRGRDGGVPVEANISQVFTVHRGRIVRGCLFQTRTEALEAVGLSEQDAHADS
jgi:ketosteroid isomerase-like protein